MKIAGFPDDFEQMARAGQLDTDDASSQLALVYADGNSVGTFLSEAAKHVSKRNIVPLIDQATVGALAERRPGEVRRLVAPSGAGEPGGW